MSYSNNNGKVPARSLGVLAGLLLWLGAPAAYADTDWILLLDRSESMTQNDPNNYRFDAQKIMVDLLAQGVGETHRLTIIRFAGKPEVVLTREVIRPQNLADIRKTISEDPPKGDTDIGAAIELARETVPPEGRASDIKLVLLSDGVQAGKIPGLTTRLEEQKKACEQMGLSINTIILNDFSISKQERDRLRGGRYHYEDKTLHEGEDLMRDLARKTHGRIAQVSPGHGIEDILLNLIAPYMSFHRESISGRVRTFPTDRQLFMLFNRGTEDVRFRIGTHETVVDLRREQLLKGDFELTVNPYSNRTVVMVRPAASTRWPDWVDILPGPSQKRVEGEIFVISNVRLSIGQGLGVQDSGAETGLKTRILENEVYPVLFRITLPDDITPDRSRMIRSTLRDATVRVEAVDADGKILKESTIGAAQVLAGTGNRLFFVPTYTGKGDTKLKEPFALNVRARIELDGASGLRAVARASDRSFVVFPGAFQWQVRRNWKGEPESSSRPLSQRQVQLELGQEFRLEVFHAGNEVLGDIEIFADFSAAGESAARKLVLRDMGGVPRAFRSEWIFPPTPGRYHAKVTVKSNVVQEVSYSLFVLRDDFRPADARYTRDGTDTARAGDLGSFVMGETVTFGRTRTIDRLDDQATETFWESVSATPAQAHILKREAGGGNWVFLQKVPLKAESPAVSLPQIRVTYRGEASGFGPGEYAVAWPGKRPLHRDVSTDSRSDVFRILEKPFAAVLCSEDGTPLKIDGGKAVHRAATRLVLRVTPTSTFPQGSSVQLAGTLTWARKDVGGPQVVKAIKGTAGEYSLTFPTTDFHTGAAKLRLALQWKAGGREHSVEDLFEITSLPKALGLSMEPIEENLYLGQSEKAVKFRIRAIGGQSPQVQRDLLSLWLSQPVNTTIGDSEQLYRVQLTADGDSLVGSLDLPELPPGSYKLVVNSLAAKLGQDITACFFNVRARPFTARALASASGQDRKLLLGPDVTRGVCRGEGLLWVVVAAEKAAGGTKGPEIASASLRIGEKTIEGKWGPADGGGIRSESIPLEDVPSGQPLSVTVKDKDGRVFAWSIGTLKVQPVPLSLEVTWTKAVPEELGRGEFCRIQGEVCVRGADSGLREALRDKLRASVSSSPFVTATPASVLKGLRLLPVPAAGAAGGAVFGERIPFEASLRVSAGDAELKDRFTVEVRDEKGEVVDLRRVSIGLSPTRLQMGRPGAGAAEILPQDYLPITVGERVRLAVEDKSGRGQARSSIQVFAPSKEGAPSAERAFLTSETGIVDWTPKEEGDYRVLATAYSSVERGWETEEVLKVAPPLGLEWSRDSKGTVRLNAGQHLPLFVRVSGPRALDWEAFQRFFRLQPEVLGEGGQVLAVEFSPWEPDRGVSGGGVAIKAFSTKPIPGSAARARVSLQQAPGGKGAATLETLELDLVRAGGSLVVVGNFEQGPEHYDARDLGPDLEVARGTRLRFGFRTGTTLSDVEPLKDKIALTVTAPGEGGEKVLDVESVSAGLIVFVPYEAREFGRYKLRLEIKGETMQLLQEPEFTVVKGFAEHMELLALAAIGLVVLVLLVFLGRRGQTYQKDRKTILERIRGRKEKALVALEKEPGERLAGEAKINLSGRVLGPLDMKSAPSAKEVTAWVDQHFSRDESIFSDDETNKKRRSLIVKSLDDARTELMAVTENRLPVRAADLCLKGPATGKKDVGLLDALVVHDVMGSKPEGVKTLLSIRLLEGGKVRISTPSGKTATFARSEDYPFNGWVGKSEDQIRASVKIPGIAEYATVTVDLK